VARYRARPKRDDEATLVERLRDIARRKRRRGYRLAHQQLRKEGVDLDTAIQKSGEIRFLPIVLTTITAIGGLIPIALSTNPLISPLAIVLIGGLISSTLLSRIVTPVLYKLLPPRI
jgi:multidrug efflux pump subunit AcrB